MTSTVPPILVPQWPLPCPVSELHANLGVAGGEYCGLRGETFLLTLATGRGRYDQFGLAGGVFGTIGFIERIQRVCRPGLPLAPPAMAGMHDQRASREAIADLSAGCIRLPYRSPSGSLVDALGPGRLCELQSVSMPARNR
jgi:hypothetical protein